MTLFTGKGDNGTTTTFGCNQRFSKSSVVAEALGTVDEINSYIGVCKVLADKQSAVVQNEKIADILHSVQEQLFIVQAEIGGADMRLGDEKVREVERVINTVEKILPPIKTFFISGGTSLGAHLDYARTLSRRAERRVIAVQDEGSRELGKATLAYLNRLSSLLYALARYVNYEAGADESAPSYE